MWKRPVIKTLFGVLLLSFSGGVEGQMSLSEVVDKALEENYEVRLSKLDEKQARNRNTFGNAGFMPSVTLQGRASSGWTNTRQVFFNAENQERKGARSNSQSAGLMVNWTIFDGFAMFARKERLEHLVELGEADTRYYVSQTVADLATVYYQLQQEKKRLELLRSTLTLSDERLALEKERLELGSGSELRVQQARMDRDTDSSLVLQQKARLRELRIRLSELMGLEPDQRIEPGDPMKLREPLKISKLRDSTLKKNARISRAQIQEMVERTERDIVEGEQWPEVSLFGSYNYDRSTSNVGFFRANREFGPTLGVRVRFDLYDGGKKRTERQNAALDIEKQKVAREQLEQEVEAALLKTHERYRLALERVDLAEDRVRNAEGLMEKAKKRFEEGMIDHIEYREIQLKVLEAENALLRTRFEAKQNEIALLRLSGGLVERVMDGG